MSVNYNLNGLSIIFLAFLITTVLKSADRAKYIGIGLNDYQKT